MALTRQIRSSRYTKIDGIHKLDVYFYKTYVGEYEGTVIGKNLNSTRFDRLKHTLNIHSIKDGKIILPNGYGILSDVEENVFNGKFILGNFIFGEITYANGSYYHGNVKRGQPHGMGRKYFLNGNIYKGNFKDGNPDGIGIMHYSDGDIYTGNFVNGSPQGRGIMKHPDGTFEEGLFEMGNFV
jgi:hypothetical protein